MHKVFISHSFKDANLANALCNFIEANHIPCWLAPRDIKAGKDYGFSIIEAIKSTEVLLLIYSGHVNNSEHVKREVERAIKYRKIILPVKIENVLPSQSIEYFLSTSHWLNAITKPIENHFQSVAKSVLDLLKTMPLTIYDGINTNNFTEKQDIEFFNLNAPNEWHKSKKKNVLNWLYNLLEDKN